MRIAALTASQQHPSSRARCEMVSPAPICLTTHLAALVVSMQPLAAIRWSPSVNDPSAHAGPGRPAGASSSGCSSAPRQRAGRRRRPRAVLDPGPAVALGTRGVIDPLFDGDLTGRPRLA